MPPSELWKGAVEAVPGRPARRHKHSGRKNFLPPCIGLLTILFLVSGLNFSQFRSHDAFVGFYAGLVEGVYVGEFAFVSYGHSQHVEELAEVVSVELRQGEASVVALVGCQSVSVGLAGNFECLAHGYAGDVGQFLGFGEDIRDSEVIFPVSQTDELHDFVELAFLMLLRLGVHIRGADSNERRTAVAYFLAVLVVLLAEGFSEQLDVPFGNGLHVIAIGHHDFDIAAMFFRSGKLQCSIEHSRVLPEVIILAGLVHIAGAFEEGLNVKAHAGSQRQTNFAEDGETAAHPIGYSVLRPAFFDSQLLEEGLLFHVRVGYSNHFHIDIAELLQGIIDDHEARHRVERTAGLGDNEEQHFEVALFVGFGDFGAVFEVMDDVTRAARVDVLTAEDNFREAIAFCLRQFVPEFTAMHIKDNLVAQEGAADTQGYNEIHVVLYMVGQFLQVLQGRRAVEVAFFNIGQLGEQNLFRLAVLGQMCADKGVKRSFLVCH